MLVELEHELFVFPCYQVVPRHFRVQVALTSEKYTPFIDGESVRARNLSHLRIRVIVGVLVTTALGFQVQVLFHKIFINDSY